VIDLDRLPAITRRWWVLGHIVLFPLIRGAKRLRVRGAEHVPRDGPVLIVCNHVSEWDPPTVGWAARPRKSQYMAKIELFQVPVLRRIVYRMGAFPVTRGGADRRAMRMAREVLRGGGVLLMFPEGTRAREGRLRPGFPGAGALGLEAGVTTVPAAIWGSQRRFGPARVVFGPPIDLSDLDDGPRGRRAQAAVDRMMAAIAGLLPAAGGPAQDPPGHLEAAEAPPEPVDG